MSTVQFQSGAPAPSGSSIIAPEGSGGGSGSNGVTIEEAGMPVVTDATAINFASGATVTASGKTASVVITGGGGGVAASVLGPWNGGADADQALTPMDYTNFGQGWVATRAGNITGLSALHGEDPISAGTINFHVTINGSTTVVGVGLDMTHQTQFVDGESVAFVAGDIIGISYSTTSDLSGDGIDIAAAVTITLAAS